MSHSILGIRWPKYFQECLLKFTFAKMSFEEAKNINTRRRFQSILSVEKPRELHGLVPPYLISNFLCSSLFAYCLSLTAVSIPQTAQAQSRPMVFSYLCVAGAFFSFRLSSNATSPEKPTLILSSILLLLSHLSLSIIVFLWIDLVSSRVWVVSYIFLSIC